MKKAINNGCELIEKPTNKKGDTETRGAFYDCTRNYWAVSTQTNSKKMKAKVIHFNYSDFALLRDIALTFPNTEESVSHEGTPSIKVRGKLMFRLHESGEFFPIHLDFDNRDKYLERYPEIFHLPDHFIKYPYICMWIHQYDKKLLHEILELSWKSLSTKKQIQDYEMHKNND